MTKLNRGGVSMRCFKHIAKLIRTKRVQHPKGYSQSELSHLLGYKNGQFISNVERALCNIPLKMLKKVSEVLDISAQELKEAILKDQEDTLNAFLNYDGEVSRPVNFNNDSRLVAINSESVEEKPENEEKRDFPFHQAS